MAATPIFFDPSGRRATRLSRGSWSLAIAGAILAAAFVATLFIVDLPHDARAATETHAPIVAPPMLLTASMTARLAGELRDREKEASRLINLRRRDQSGKNAVAARTSSGSPLTIGFYVNWDDASYPALRKALPHLDWVVPAWLSLQGDDMALKTDIDQKALDLIAKTKPSTPILPLIQNAVEGNWDGKGLATLLADPARRAARLREIVAVLQANDFRGITIDFEEVPPGAQTNLRAFLGEMSAAFSPHGWTIALAVPFDDDNWDYKAYAKLADFLILMAYDQHWEEGTPGSIAGQSWFRETLDARMKDLDPGHTIVAIGNYGYDWVKGRIASDISFQDPVLAARDSEASVEFDPESSNPHFSYVEDDGKTHDVWFLDGVTAFNEIHAADSYRPAGYALWRLGAEDPSIWSVLGRPYDAPAPDGLRNMASGEDIDVEGNGEILKVSTAPKSGARTLEIDPQTGDIDKETYTALPTPYVIHREGAVQGEVALTFDDGPDPIWTAKILDVLKAKGVPGTFFIIGENAAAHPDLVRRMIVEGHDVGNHTYTHPNIAEIPTVVAKLELNATQRLFEALTGRSLRLFRPPYLGDAEPTTSDEVLPVALAQEMGYTTVGLHIDPDDWQRPPAKEIVDRVLKQLADPDPDVSGNIILLHDSGGDRAQTVAALPGIIDALRAKGYQFVTVAALAGLSRDQAMPLLPRGSMAQELDASVFLVIGWVGYLLPILFMVAVCLGIARLIFLCSLAIANARQRARQMPPSQPLPLSLQSVLIPAYNEAKVIRTSIDRVLASDYSNLEVIVIDDGSQDGTSDVVGRYFGEDPRVALITIQNGGKANALNIGLQRARGDVVVALDADTQFKSDTISKLVRWFADPTVAAVAGNAKVGNRVNTITRWQALEYITAQNLERRALSALGCITVVPGAVGAWRREVVNRLGGYPTDTVAEDQDLTIAIQKAGYKILFDSEASAYTEAPDTLRTLAKQRFRWAYGTLQCLWKHRDITFRRRYGALGIVALPQVWLFQILFSMLSPLVDLMFLWQVAATVIDYLNHGDQFNSDNLARTSIYYGLFLGVDLAAAVLAFSMERKEKWRLLWWLALQRYGYRQLTYFVVVRAALSAIAGPFVGWGKLERKATVSASYEPVG